MHLNKVEFTSKFTHRHAYTVTRTHTHVRAPARARTSTQTTHTAHSARAHTTHERIHGHTHTYHIVYNVRLHYIIYQAFSQDFGGEEKPAVEWKIPKGLH